MPSAARCTAEKLVVPWLPMRRSFQACATAAPPASAALPQRSTHEADDTKPSHPQCRLVEVLIFQILEVPSPLPPAPTPNVLPAPNVFPALNAAAPLYGSPCAERPGARARPRPSLPH